MSGGKFCTPPLTCLKSSLECAGSQGLEVEKQVGTLKGEVGHYEAKLLLLRVSQRSWTLTPPSIWRQEGPRKLLEARRASGPGPARAWEKGLGEAEKGRKQVAIRKLGLSKEKLAMMRPSCCCFGFPNALGR